MQARQTPTFERYHCTYATTDGPMGAELASAFFGEPLEWQSYVLDRMLARDANDKYAYHALAVIVARQNGKSWDVRARCFYGLVAVGEKILYTCQHGDTADEMFRDLASVFEDEDNVELHAMLKAVRKTNGQQAIYLTNGGYIRFTTRTNSLARGRSYDVIIYDEAQELTAAQQAASLPTISASAKHNTQVIYLGTPPNNECPGTVLRDMHTKAHGGDGPAFAWLEWSVEEIGDIYDRSRWYATNPSLGVLIDESAIEGELTMDAEDFARERLGWWSPVAQAMAAIPRELWTKSAIKAIGDHYRRKTAFAVKFSTDGSSYSVAGAKLDARGNVAFELVEVGSTQDGPPWPCRRCGGGRPQRCRHAVRPTRGTQVPEGVRRPPARVRCGERRHVAAGRAQGGDRRAHDAERAGPVGDKRNTAPDRLGRRLGLRLQRHVPIGTNRGVLARGMGGAHDKAQPRKEADDAVTRDTKDARMRAVEIVSDAGAYIATHAEDFVARAGSDEVTLADGLGITVHVRTVDELPTITIRREVFILDDAGGVA